MKHRNWNICNRLAVFLLFLFLLAPSASMAETNVTGLVEVKQTKLVYLKKDQASFTVVSVKNISDNEIFPPIKVVIDNISMPDVTVANPDGFTDDEKPYLEFVPKKDALLSGKITFQKKLYFDNPNNDNFSYSTSVFGTLEGTTPLDSDGDGVADDLDACPGTPAGEPVDENGCSASQLDLNTVIQASSLISEDAPFEVILTADISGGTPPYTVYWDCDGDGVSDLSGDIVSYTYKNYGTFPITLRVYDSLDTMAQHTQYIEIGDNSAQASVVPDQKTEVGLKDGTTVSIPAHTLDSETVITVQLVDQFPDIGNLKKTGNAYDIFFSEDQIMNGTIKITLPYDPAAVSDENSLTIYQFKTDSNEWIPCPSFVNKNDHTVTAEVDHLCVHILVETAELQLSLIKRIHSIIYDKFQSLQQDKTHIIMAAGRDAYNDMYDYLGSLYDAMSEIKDIDDSELSEAQRQNAEAYLAQMDHFDNIMTNLYSDNSSYDELYANYENLKGAYDLINGLIDDSIGITVPRLPVPFSFGDVLTAMIDQMYSFSLKTLCNAFDAKTSTNEIEYAFSGGIGSNDITPFLGRSILEDGGSTVRVYTQSGKIMDVPQKEVSVDGNLVFGYNLVEPFVLEGLSGPWRTKFIKSGRLFEPDEEYPKILPTVFNTTFSENRTDSTYALIFSFKGKSAIWKKAGIALKNNGKLMSFKLVENPFHELPEAKNQYRNWGMIFISSKNLSAIESGQMTLELRLYNDHNIDNIEDATKDDEITFNSLSFQLIDTNSQVEDPIGVDKNEVTLASGEMDTVIFLDGAGDYTVSSSNEDVAIANINENSLEITGLSAGTATITVEDADGNTAEISVTVTSDVPSPGKCGAYVTSNLWKEFDCYNLAAIGKETNADPFTPSWELNGGYWQWGRKGPDPDVIDWYNTNTSNFAHGPTGPDEEDANDGRINEWDDRYYASNGAWSDTTKTANDPCPAGYRLPSKAQWDGVIDNNTQSDVGTWSSYYYEHTNYKAGRFFGENLMLPAAGGLSRYSGALSSRGSDGFYWSSSEYASDDAWLLTFFSRGAATNYNSRLYGCSVRCISEEK